MIKITNAPFSIEGASAQSRIVHVEVIERRGDILRLRVNQIETQARTTHDVSGSFLALAEVFSEGGAYTVKLTPLEWIQNKERLSVHQQQSLLSSVSEHLVMLGFLSLDEHLPWAYAMARLGIPLHKELVEQVYRLSKRYDGDTMQWILQAVRHGFTPSEEVGDFLRHITSWLLASLAEDASPAHPEGVREWMRYSGEPPGWTAALFGNTPWWESFATALRWADSLLMVRREHDRQKYMFLIEDGTVGRWHIVLDWSQKHLIVNIMMDPALWEVHEQTIVTWTYTSRTRWEKYTGRKVLLHAHPWESPWDFFLHDQEQESAWRGINLYA